MINKLDLPFRLSRRNFCAAITLGLVFNTVGCTYFKTFMKKDKNEDANAFEEVEKNDEEEDASVFDSERKKQKEMSDYVAQNGRSKDSKKKKISNGDTFLMSDKAKEIYANTER